MSPYKWMQVAESLLGQKEIKGRQHNALILRMWQSIRAPFTDDETPWCAGFVGHCLEASGIKSSRSAAARSFLKWGDPISKPVVGCIVIFERGAGGHVGFVHGKTEDGRLLVLGGNQGDKVSIAPFDFGRVLGYRWPSAVPEPRPAPLTVYAWSGSSSRNEA